MIYKFKQFKEPQIMKNHLNLGGENNRGDVIDINSLYFTKNGKPWIPIMGEYHFSRYKKSEWYKELCKMKAGGITAVSTYLFWIYHEEKEGEFCFSGDNDIRLFIKESQKAGLDMVIRIGPWVHGECRNGGFPDWLLKKRIPLRQNNPEYLYFVRNWYSQIAVQLKGLFFKDGGNIIAVQLENELGGDAEHLAELKQIATECGIVAPIYTVTGWNCVAGAKIPVKEVVPVFGGYCDAPWAQTIEQLPPSPHYFFNAMRNDTAIGSDIKAQMGKDNWLLPYNNYPFATCELGGGIQVTHHRRPIVEGMDVYSISLIKIGVGNNLVGYYMYHGGTNKIGKLSPFNESRSTGYPNDYSILSYDFQAPISEYGEIREQYKLLNMLHLFIQDFQEVLAPMVLVEAASEVESDDVTSLRYAMRTDGVRGFVFVNHYQRLTKLKEINDVIIDTGNVVFPPINIVGDVSFFVPFHMKLGEIELEYATAQPLCRAGNTFFFIEIPGILAKYRLLNGEEHLQTAGRNSLLNIGNCQIVTLTFNEAKYFRRISNHIYLGIDCNLYEVDGEITAVEEKSFIYYKWNGEKFCKFFKKQEESIPAVQYKKVLKPPFINRYMDELQIGGERDIIWKKIIVEGNKGFIEIANDCDVSQVYANGELIADNYYYGKPWRIPAAMLNGKECFLALSERKNDFYKEF